MDKILYDFCRETFIDINLDNLSHNIREIKRTISNSVNIMAIVKANAYGHGIEYIAKAALDEGVSYLGVAFLAEAIYLREKGISAPILVLGYTPDRCVSSALDYDITMTSSSIEHLRLVNQVSKKYGRIAKIHLKIDTGMGRFGFQPDELRGEDILTSLDSLEIEGIFTHYATADEEDESYVGIQEKRFISVLNDIGINPSIVHSSNTAQTIKNKPSTSNMVRLGIGMYGLYPSENVKRNLVKLFPVLSLKSKVVHLKTLPKGSKIGYGLTYEIKGHEVIATVPIGYGDGYSRLLSNRGRAIVNGIKVPIIGRISMDQLMIDVSNASAKILDEVVFLGSQGEEEITIDEVATLLGTINYEVTTLLSTRIPRVYIKGEEVIAIVNNLRYDQANP